MTMTLLLQCHRNVVMTELTTQVAVLAMETLDPICAPTHPHPRVEHPMDPFCVPVRPTRPPADVPAPTEVVTMALLSDLYKKWNTQ